MRFRKEILPGGVIFLLLIGLVLVRAQEQVYVRVLNVSVPVRVFDGDRFVDSLALSDFEVQEDGKAQKVEAVYLIKKTGLERKDERTAFEPRTSRTFYLFFSMYEPAPELPKALTYFFKNVLVPEDRLLIVTPRATYDLRKERAARMPPEQLVAKLTKQLRKDILKGDAAYRSVLTDLKRLVGIGGIGDQMSTVTDIPEMSQEQMSQTLGVGTFEELMMKYRADVDLLVQLRTVNEKSFLQFAEGLKRIEGQKTVLYFYQKEFVPVFDNRTISNNANSPLFLSLVSELSGILNDKSSLNMDRLRKTYADSSICLHFLYLNKNPADVPLSQVAERQDIFSTFDEIAKATGGLSVSSSQADYLMRTAAVAAESYYLIYYSPTDSKQDGRFRQIEVKVKGGYRVSHLAGYFSR